MATSLSKLVDNLTEDIHGDKCVDCKSDLSYMKVIDETLIFRCFNCKKNYKKEINKELIKRFPSTYKFCNNDLNKFVMLLEKVFILMSIWMVGINLMKHQYLAKNHFIAT